MPNYCSNAVVFRHEDPEMIRRVVAGYAGEGLFAEFHPCPDQLINTMAGGYSDPVKQAALEQQERDNLDTFGHKNWYNWCVANWGTKWDVTQEAGGDADVSDDQLEVRLSFDTAWSPPIGFYRHMESLGFQVDAFYHEPGVGFCGRYQEGHDDYHDIDGDSNWVAENIPQEIDEQFAIVESMSTWESDEDSGWTEQASNEETNQENKV